jgi:hypothetical protein
MLSYYVPKWSMRARDRIFSTCKLAHKVWRGAYSQSGSFFALVVHDGMRMLWSRDGGPNVFILLSEYYYYVCDCHTRQNQCHQLYV